MYITGVTACLPCRAELEPDMVTGETRCLALHGGKGCTLMIFSGTLHRSLDRVHRFLSSRCLFAEDNIMESSNPQQCPTCGGLMKGDFTSYRWKKITEMRPYVPGESIFHMRPTPKDGPRLGDMVARYPEERQSEWIVSQENFEKNFFSIETEE